MPISFPSSPSTDDEYTFGSTTWVFNSVGWVVVRATAAPIYLPSGPYVEIAALPFVDVATPLYVELEHI